MKNIYLKQFFTIIIIITFNQSFSQTTIILQPGPDDGKDAMVRTLYPNTPHGDEETIMPAAWTYSGEFGITRSLFEFDLSVIPDSAQVLDARLNLYYNPSCGHEGHYGENESYLQRITSSWEEYSVNWNNQPSVTYDNQVRIQTSTISTQDYPDINVTALIIDMINDPENNFGFMLKLQDESKYRSLIFASSDHPVSEIRPKLVITYDCEEPTSAFSYSLENNSVQFIDESLLAESWYWDFGDGYFSNLQNPIHSYSENGNYFACLTVENDCSTDIFCDTIKYYLGSDNYLILAKNFNVFPNPSKGEIYIDLKNLINQQVYICIFNSHGITIHEQSNIINTNEKILLIDLSIMPKGIYFVKVVSDSFTETRKILLN